MLITTTRNSRKAMLVFSILSVFWAANILWAATDDGSAEKQRPNFVILFADDLGYGDLSCYGHPTICTPNLDQLASEGMRFTQFYAAASVCTPSRAALMTGRLPIRSGMCHDECRVLFPMHTQGLPHEEITLAELLKQEGYATACIGKWHLGHRKGYLPVSQGFDSYFGIPYSNDMKPCVLMRDEEVIERPVEQKTLTKRYTQEALDFIHKNRERPFFLYLPYTFPHVPLHASEKFAGRSRRGLYGDVVEELDWSVGRIVALLRELELAENTLVIFTSDNGPWSLMKLRGGSAGLLRGAKGSAWEGGMREPALAWWPGHIKAGQINGSVVSTMDLLPTCCALAGVEVPSDRILDGEDVSSVLLKGDKRHERTYFYYRGTRLFAVRYGPWKAHFMSQAGYGMPKPKKHDPPLLYHLERDPSEKYNVADKHPEMLEKIEALVQEHRSDLTPVKNVLEIIEEKK